MGLKSILSVTTQRTIKKTGKTSTETRLYITLLPPDLVQLARAIHTHWSYPFGSQGRTGEINLLFSPLRRPAFIRAIPRRPGCVATRPGRFHDTLMDRYVHKTSIEKNLHWTLDVTFREDQCHARKDHAARNLAMIRRAVLNMLRREPSKILLKRKRLKAAMNHEFRSSVIVC